jgi:hypothetical protein
MNRPATPLLWRSNADTKLADDFFVIVTPLDSRFVEFPPGDCRAAKILELFSELGVFLQELVIGFRHIPPTLAMKALTAMAHPSRWKPSPPTCEAGLPSPTARGIPGVEPCSGRKWQASAMELEI